MKILSSHILMSIVAGIAATTLMTAFVMMAKLITGKQLNVIRILGTMLTGSTTDQGAASRKFSSLAMGTIVHYGVGLFFSLIYAVLWSHQIIDTDWLTTTLLGFITGLIGISVWRIYLHIHAHPPLIPLKLYLACIIAAHVVFAWTARWILI